MSGGRGYSGEAGGSPGSVEKGVRGETGFPPRERAEGERRSHEHVCATAPDETGVHVADGAERRVVDVHLDVVPALEPERPGSLVRAEAEERVDGDDVAPPGLAPRDPLELAKLLERVDAHVGIRADAHPDCADAQLAHGNEAVAEVRFRRRAHAHARAGVAEQVELA